MISVGVGGVSFLFLEFLSPSRVVKQYDQTCVLLFLSHGCQQIRGPSLTMLIRVLKRCLSRRKYYSSSSFIRPCLQSL